MGHAATPPPLSRGAPSPTCACMPMLSPSRLSETWLAFVAEAMGTGKAVRSPPRPVLGWSRWVRWALLAEGEEEKPADEHPEDGHGPQETYRVDAPRDLRQHGYHTRPRPRPEVEGSHNHTWPSLYRPGRHRLPPDGLGRCVCGERHETC
jgi:hypothetical protein